MKNRIYLLILLSNLIIALDEPFIDQLKSIIQKDEFTINALLKLGFRYSFEYCGLQGERTFETTNSRFSVSGILDNIFFYKIQVNFVSEANLLDAFFLENTDKQYGMSFLL